MKKKENCSVQKWLPIEEVLENGIIQTKAKKYIKILKVTPIHYHLKSKLEKEAILNSYKLFLQSFEENIQILVKSNKEDLSKHISNIQKYSQKENNQKTIETAEKYIAFIQKMNLESKSSSKNFFIILSEVSEKHSPNNLEKTIIIKLEQQYLKIKEALNRCGNMVHEIKDKKEIIILLKSLFLVN